MGVKVLRLFHCCHLLALVAMFLKNTGLLNRFSELYPNPPLVIVANNDVNILLLSKIAIPFF
jgi:hypothetical protein